MVYKTNSDKETISLAKKIAQAFKRKGGIIFLKGELGAGKTTFVRGFSEALGIKEKVISPSFVLVRQHVIHTNKMLFHIDFYRLPEKSSQKEIGISDMIKNKENILLIEWPQKIQDLPNPDLTITFTIDSANKRTIHVI